MPTRAPIRISVFWNFVFISCVCLGLASCKSSSFEDIFKRCEPACTEFESPVPIKEVTEAFASVIDSVDVQDDDMTGRWVMLSGSRYATDTGTERSVSDLLFTKSMVMTESENGEEISVSDCYSTEVYPLSKSGFTIPQDSAFFDTLYFENKNDIEVDRLSDILLQGEWQFITPQGSTVDIQVDMYKVNNDDSPDAKLGSVNGEDDIFCYSYLHTFSAIENFFSGQWIPAEGEIKEMSLRVDPNSGDENIALGSQRVNDDTEYSIEFNFALPSNYECFGVNTIKNSTDDFLSFKGSFDITIGDLDCDQPLGTKSFSLLAL